MILSMDERFAPVAVFFAALLSAGGAEAVQITRTERLTTNSKDQYNPVISGNWVVYTDNRDGNAEIYLFDLTTREELNLTNDPSSQVLNDVEGDFVVYTDYQSGNAEIWAYYLPDRQACRLTFNPSTQSAPALAGQFVVYQDDRNQDLDIYAFDLTVLDTNDFAGACQRLESGELQGETGLRVLPDRQVLPKTSGRYVVWQDFRSGAPRVVAYDRQADVELAMPESGKNQVLPSIDGAHVVYIEDDGATREVMYYDLETETSIQLTADNHRQNYPSISGRYVAWEDDRGGNLDIYVYDLENGTLSPVTTDPANQYLNDLDGGRVVFTDASSGNLDIVLVEFSPDPAPPSCDRPSEVQVAVHAIDDPGWLTARELTLWPFTWWTSKEGSHDWVDDSHRLSFSLTVDHDIAEAVITWQVSDLKSKLSPGLLKKGLHEYAGVVMRVNGVERRWEVTTPLGDDAWIDVTFSAVPLFAGENVITLEGPHYARTFLKSRHVEISGFSVLERKPCLPADPIALCHAQHAEVLYGPETFVRHPGLPEASLVSYQESGSVSAVLCVTNGDGDGTGRVSSAVILHNQQEVFGPSAFGQQVRELAAPITVFPENLLSVELRSTPGSFVSVKVVRARPLASDLPSVELPRGCSGVSISGASGGLSLRLSLCLASVIFYSWRRRRS